VRVRRRRRRRPHPAVPGASEVRGRADRDAEMLGLLRVAFSRCLAAF
jgi:hypothetical protein